MSRRTVIAALTGAVLVGGLAGPGLASHAQEGSAAHYVCVRLIADPRDGGREGLCVWTPMQLAGR